MEKEKSSVEITNVFPKAPEMFVIKGRQHDFTSLPIQPIYIELKKFAGIKDTATFQLRLPLESFWKRTIKRAADIVQARLERQPVVVVSATSSYQRL